MPSRLIKGAKIAIVGEAPGEQEERIGQPFVGTAGQELRSMLAAVGLALEECSLLNTFNERPEKNNLELFMGKKAECGKDYPYAPIRQGKYILPKYLHNLTRLRSELLDCTPNIVVALGNTACWALLGSAGISKLRGTVAKSVLVKNLKVLPTYHPAAVLRQWELRPVVLADLMKAKNEAEFPEINYPKHELWLEPSLEDMEEFFKKYLVSADYIAFDIETAGGEITCIGFAPDPVHALVIPFVDKRKPGRSYWPSQEKESLAWAFIKRVLSLPCAKIAQNGMYDMQWLWRKYGVTPKGAIHDTMLMHHAMQPELEKGLGFLGSIYTNTPAWKLMRGKANETTKRDDE